MMTRNELEAHLSMLRLTQTEAAQLLGISARTVRRWFEGEEVPGPAEAALRAWRQLAERNLPWRPDSVSIVEDDQHQIALMRQHAIDLAGLISRVEARGGPRMPWSVDIAEGKASLGPAKVSFHNLLNGGFSIGYYSRKDEHPDVRADWENIEDAVFCISKEFEKYGQRATALRAVADDIRSKSAIFGTRGPTLPTRMERLERQKEIEALADRIAALADETIQGRPTTYQQFAAILSQLSAAGYSPAEESLISAVARSYVQRERGVRVLFVKSGKHDDAVTKTQTLNAARVEKLVSDRRLRPLGAELPILGESRRLQSYTGPDHVVIDVPRDVEISGVNKPGLYLIEGLRPSDV